MKRPVLNPFSKGVGQLSFENKVWISLNKYPGQWTWPQMAGVPGDMRIYSTKYKVLKIQKTIPNQTMYFLPT